MNNENNKNSDSFATQTVIYNDSIWVEKFKWLKIYPQIVNFIAFKKQ